MPGQLYYKIFMLRLNSLFISLSSNLTTPANFANGSPSPTLILAGNKYFSVYNNNFSPVFGRGAGLCSGSVIGDPF